MPVASDTSTIPLEWTFKYIVPSTHTVVASGLLAAKYIEDSTERTVYHYKLKES